jgi:small subunit ribosomal protein S16
MSLVVRLSQTGRKGERKFRVVVEEKRSKISGRPVDTIGWFEMGPNGGKKLVDHDKYNSWLTKGAIPSPTVVKVMANPAK